jgi:uncharacterized protein YecT (DUF1311 family)
MSALLKINVNDHTEKKNGLTYLSWAWAWAEVLKHDPEATWVCHTYGPQGAEEPCMRIGKTAMVHVSVTIKGLRRDCMLPVMDHRNKAIQDPDAFAVNTAIMRCMTKAISMHGLGLYIYAGEDLPEVDEAEREERRRAWIDARKAEIASAKTSGELKAIMSKAIDMVRSQADQAAEDELNEAFAEKIASAKQKEPSNASPSA